jgi:hypothetical protein
MSGPFELLGDPDAAACEGDACALPPAPPREAPDDEETAEPPAA